jgi:hypothetical protein
MNDMEPTPPTFSATQPISCTLEAQEWQVVFAGLNELPMRVSRAIFDKLLGQVTRGNRAAVENNVSH